MESLKSFLVLLFDSIFPRSEEIMKLEGMSASELFRAVPKCENIDQNIIAFFEYRHPLMRTAIWQLKYHHNRKISSLLAEALYGCLLEELADLQTFYYFTSPLLVPIPLSKERLRKRGYNQTEELANILCTFDQNRSFELDAKVLSKIVHTPPQSTLHSRSRRLKNLNGCFKVMHPEKIKGRNIILLDDVVTTGATFHEAARILTDAGARKIFCIALAH